MNILYAYIIQLLIVTVFRLHIKILFFILRCNKSRFQSGPKVLFVNFGPDATGPLTASYGVDTSGAFTTKLRPQRKRKRLDQSARMADKKFKGIAKKRRIGQERGKRLDAANGGYGPGMDQDDL